MTRIPVEIHQIDRQRAQDEAGELTELQMALVTGFGLSTIICVYMIIFYAMALWK
jgi:hypothetical protein